MTPASVSVNEKVGAGLLLGFDGFAVIDGAGGAVRSTVHVNEVGALTSAPSFASTLKVWLPAARPL